MSYYSNGNGNYNDKDARYNDDKYNSLKENRRLERLNLVFTRNVWNRSPSPPANKEKHIAKPKLTSDKDEIKRTNFNEFDNLDSYNKSKHDKKNKSEKKSKKSYSDDDSIEIIKKSKKEKKSRNNKHSSDDSNSDKSSIKKHKKDKKSKKSHNDNDSFSDSNSIKRQKTLAEDIKNSVSLNELSRYDKIEAEKFREEVQGKKYDNDNDDDDNYGPKPLPKLSDLPDDKSYSYGKALMPGEGAAIAQYVQRNMRIPRRGEIGWSGEDIESLEAQGYVMSGSRHAKMNAVRIRKENQVYSAEEKKALALITMEERQQKDNKIVADFKQILTQKLKASGFLDNDNNKDQLDDET